jgi:hypothetical protein
MNFNFYNSTYFTLIIFMYFQQVRSNNFSANPFSNFIRYVMHFQFLTKSASHDSTNSILKIYGISQNPEKKNYIIMVLSDCYCKKCGNQYTDIEYKWCKPCQINYLKNNFANWTSGNKKIDELIQEMQLKVNKYNDIIVEWIPYDQFNDISKIGKGGFSIVYSALWKNGPLQYDTNNEELKKKYSIEVALKCLFNSQNISNGFLNEV